MFMHWELVGLYAYRAFVRPGVVCAVVDNEGREILIDPPPFPR